MGLLPGTRRCGQLGRCGREGAGGSPGGQACVRLSCEHTRSCPRGQRLGDADKRQGWRVPGSRTAQGVSGLSGDNPTPLCCVDQDGAQDSRALFQGYTEALQLITKCWVRCA